MKSLYTDRPPVTAEPEDTSQNTREEALSEIARYATIISVVAAVINLQAWGPSTALSTPPLWFNFILAAGFGVIFALRSRRPLQQRAAFIILLLYAAAIGAFAIFGLSGSGTIFLLGAAVLAAIFFGIQAGTVASGVAVGIAIVYAYLFLTGNLVPALAPDLRGTLGEWISITGNVVLVFAMLIVPQRHLWESQAFVLAISKQKQELLDTRATLQKQTRQLEQATADLAGVNMQLQEQSHVLERRAQQLTAGAEIGRAATATFDLPTLLDTTVNLVRDRFGFYHASVFIVEPGSTMAEIRASTGEAGEQLKARRHQLAIGSKSLVGAATAQRQPVIVQDVLADPNYYPNPLLPDTRAEAVLPLLRGDTIIGALDVQGTLPNAFTESDLAILSAITDQLAVAVQNARLYTETQAAVSENAALFKISAALAEANSLQDILEAVAKNAMPQGNTRASLLLISYGLDNQPLDLEVRAYYDTEGQVQRLGQHIPVATTPLIAQLGFAPIAVADIYSDPQMDAVTRETMAKLEMISACFVPLRTGGQLIGALLTSAAQPVDYNPQELALLRSSTDQIVVAMEKFRLLQEARRRAEQAAAAAEIGRAATATFDLPTLLETTVNLIRDRFGFYHASVFIVEPGSSVAELRESTGEAGRKLKERKHKLAIGSKSLVGAATAQRQPVIVQDVRADPSYYPNPLLPDTRAEAVFPMVSGEAIIGAVDVQSTLPNAFVESETGILTTIVDQLAVAVQNARLYVETQARLNELATLNQVSRAISSTIDINQVYRAVREQISAALGAENLYLGLYDAAADQITFPFMVERGQLIPFEPRLPTGRMHYILHQHQPLLLQGDAAQVAEQLRRLGITTTGMAKSYLGVPLMLGQRAIGVLAVQDFDRANVFNPNHLRILTTVADQLAVAIQNARLYAETQDRLGELATLNDLGRAFSSTINVEQIYQAVREQVPAVMDVSDIYLALYDEERDQVAFPLFVEEGHELTQAPRGPTGLTGHILRTRETLLLQGTTEEVRQQMETLGAVTTAAGAAKSYLGVPLLAGQRVIGVLAVQSMQRANAFDANHQRILATIADQLAVVLQNSRLFAQTQAALAENATLFKISRALSEATTMQSILEAILTEALPAGCTRSGLLWVIYNEQGQVEEIEVRAHLDITGEYRRLGLRIPAQAIPFIQKIAAVPIPIANIDTDLSLDAQTRETMRKMEMIATCFVPIFIGGRLTAVMTTSGGQPVQFQPRDIAVLQGVSDLAAVTLVKLQLLDETRRRAEQLAAAAEIGRAATASFDLPTILETTVNLIRDRFGFYHASAFIIEPGSTMAELRESTGEAGRQLKARKHMLAIGSKSLVGTATATRQPVVVQDVRADPNYYPNPLLPEPRAEAVLPLIAGDTVVGAVDVQSTLRGAFAEDDLAILATIARQLAVAVQNARLFVQTQDALADTEDLYEANADLNAATSYQDILNVIRRYTVAGEGTHIVSLSVFDRPFSSTSRGEIIDAIAVWSSLTPEHEARLPRRFRVTDFPAFDAALHPDQSTVIEDVATTPVFSETARALYHKVLGGQSVIFEPLRVGEQWLGYINLIYPQPRKYSETSLRRLTVLAGQAAVALNSLRLFDDTRTALAETDALYRASAELNTARSYQDVLNVIPHYTVAGEAALVALNLFDEPFSNTSRGQFIDSVAYWTSVPPEQRPTLQRPPRTRVAELPEFETFLHADRLTVVEDFATTPELFTESGRAAFIKGLGQQSAIFAPLKVGDQWLGYVNMFYPQPRKFTEVSQRQLLGLVSQAAVAVNSLRLFEDTRTALAETDVLYRASAEINTATAYPQVLEALRQHTLLGRNAQNVSLNFFDRPWLPDSPPEWITTIARWTELPTERLLDRYPLAAFPSASKLLQAQAPTLIEEVSSDPRLDANARQLYAGQFGAKSTLFVPLVVGGQWLGYLNGIYQQATTFPEAEVRQLMTLAGQAAVAINSLRLFQDTQNALAENATLFDVSRALAPVETLPGVLEAIAQHAMPKGAHMLALAAFHLDAQGQPDEFEISGLYMLGRGYQPSGGRLPFIADFAPWWNIASRKEVFVVPDVRADSPVLNDRVRADFARFGGGAACFVPLQSGGQPYGLIVIAAPQPQQFAPSDIAVLNGISDLLAITLEKLDLTEETHRRAEQLAAAAEIGRAATASFDLPSVLETTVNLIRDRFGFYHASIFIIEPGSTMAEVRESTGEAGRQLKERKHALAVGSKSLVGTATATRQPVVVQDVRADPGYFANPLLPDTQAEAVIPLLVGDTVVGAIDAQSVHRGVFGDNDLAILATIAGQLAVAVQNASLFGQTQAALSENATLFKISRALSEVETLQGILEVIAADALPKGATRTGLLWVHYDERGQAVEIEIRAHVDITGEHDQRLGLRLPAQAGPFIHQLPPGPLVIPNIDTFAGIDPITRETMRRMKMVSTCLIPLYIGGRLEAVITASASQVTQFQPGEISILRGISELLTVTLDKLRLLDETRRRAEQLATAAEIGRAATASFDLPAILETTVNLIRDRFGFYHASIFTIEPGSNLATLRESTGEAGRQLKARKHVLAVGSKSLVGTATATRRPVVVQDVRADPNYYPNPLLPETRAEAVVPLIAGDTVVGAIDVQSTQRGAFSEGDLAILATIAGQLAVAVQNVRLYEQTARWANRERMANQITNRIRSVGAGDIDGMLRTAVGELRKALGTSHGAVQIMPERGTMPAASVTTGQVKAILDQIIAERAHGDEGQVEAVKAKLLLKGINPDSYTATTVDNPALLSRVKQIAAEMQVSVKPN